MYRLLRLTFLLISVLSAIVIVTRLVGNQKNTTSRMLFTNPDGTPCERPCLFGIRPEKTNREEAIELFKAHPLTSNLVIGSGPTWIQGTGSGQGLLEGNSVIVEIGLREGKVSDIAIFMTQNGGYEHHPQSTPLMSLGELIASFGAPDLVYDDGVDQLRFFFPMSGIEATVPHEDAGGFEQYQPRLDGKVNQIIVRKSWSMGSKSRSGWCGFTTRQCPLGDDISSD